MPAPAGWLSLECEHVLAGVGVVIAQLRLLGFAVAHLPLIPPEPPAPDVRTVPHANPDGLTRDLRSTGPKNPSYLKWYSRSGSCPRPSDTGNSKACESSSSPPVRP